VDLLVMSKL